MSAFFNHAGSSPPTEAVVDRMVRHLRREHEIGGYEAAAEVVDELATVRATVGAALGAPSSEIALTSGATDAWERAIWAHLAQPRFDGGIRFVTDPFTYVSMWTSLLRWRSFRPLDVEVAAATADGTVDLESLAELAVDADVVLLTHIPTHQGTVTPVGSAVEVVREVAPDALVAVDIAQSAGQMALDLTAIGADLAFAPGRKFLRAPRGTGVLHVRGDLVGGLVPLGLPGGAAAEDGRIVGLPDDATRFEVFERPIAAMLGFGVAVAELTEVGLDAVESQVGRRSDELRTLLADVSGVRLVGSASDRGIVTFTHDRLDPQLLATRLGELGVSSRFIPSVAPLTDGRGGFGGRVRLSPHHCTTDAEMAHLGEALARL